MPYNSTALITAARAQHPAFHPQRVPDESILLPRISIEQQMLLQRIAAINRTILTQVHTNTGTGPSAHIALATPTAIPAFKAILGATVIEPSLNTAMAPVPFTQRYRPLTKYAFYELNGQLFLAGDTANYSAVTSIQFVYIPEAVTLANLTTNLVLPDNTFSVMVAMTALHCAQHLAGFDRKDVQGLGEINVPWFQSRADESLKLYLEEIGARKMGTMATVTDGML